jgi:protein-disulfide isomerase
LTFNGSVIPSYAGETQVPGFGNEKSQTEVIVYSDYFCPACSKTDEQTNNVLRKIQDKVKIHFVDVPMHAGSLEYAEVFLYAWMQNKNNLEVATQVREMLFAAAKRKMKQREVLDILKTQGIAFHVDKGQAGEIFRRMYNPLMKKDGVNGTPSIVIIKDNHRKKYQGTIEIVKALEEAVSP